MSMNYTYELASIEVDFMLLLLSFVQMFTEGGLKKESQHMLTSKATVLVLTDYAVFSNQYNNLLLNCCFY